MTDSIFGELKSDGHYWYGKQTLDFGGTSHNVDILINQRSEESEITKKQQEAFGHFVEKWPEVQSKLIDALIKYYNEEERFAWGPEDEEELAQWWPEIETQDALLQAVELETIVVPEDFIMDSMNGRYIYLLFSRAWGGEDWDDNGIGVAFLNEEIDEIAYKDIAF